MRTHKDKLVLGLAFVVAIALHAALLPWVGAAVGERPEAEPVFDIVVTELDAPAYAVAGRQIFTSAMVDNYQDGELLVNPYHTRTDRLLLSRDRTADADDVVLETREVHGMYGDEQVLPVARLEWPPFLPDDADGPYWLIYQADAQEQTPDTNRANNTFIKPIFIDGPEQPELAIEHFNTPLQATAGGSVLVDFAVRNVGKGWASGSPLRTSATQSQWTDIVLLSTDRVPNLPEDLDDPGVPNAPGSRDLVLRKFDRYVPLGPDTPYHHERVELNIPRGVNGTLFLILMADATQVLDQPSFKRSITVQPIEIIDNDTPDLVVASIQDPGRLVIGRPSPVTFSIANLGSVPTVNSNWTDGLYLSKKKELDDTAVRIGDAPADQPLQPRSRYETKVDVNLPENIEPGEWFLIVKADADEAIDEQGFDDNNTFAVPVVVLTQEQADAEIQLGDPERPERMVVQWIEHERVEEHLARLSRTVQPALQDKAEPLPDAPLNFHPEPPSIAAKGDKPKSDPTKPQPKVKPENQQDARPNPNALDPTKTDTAPKPQDPSSNTPKKIDGVTGSDGKLPSKQDGLKRPDLPNDPNPNDPTPDKQDKPSPLPGDREVKSPADDTAPDTDSKTDSKTPADRESDTDSKNPKDNDATKPSDQTKDTKTDKTSDNNDAEKPSANDGKGETKVKQDDASSKKPADETSARPKGDASNSDPSSKKQDPTRVPKDDNEAPPTNNRKVEVALQEGRVLVGKGLKITTKLPTQPGTGARRFSLPRNARISITFGVKIEDGKKVSRIVRAKVIRTTTIDYWDQAIQSSLYRWEARGEEIDALEGDQTITIQWDYLLNELFDGEAEKKPDPDAEDAGDDKDSSEYSDKDTDTAEDDTADDEAKEADE